MGTDAGHETRTGEPPQAFTANDEALLDFAHASYPKVREVSAMMDATDPDLSAFHARGGRLIVLENMADYAQSPYAGIRHVESVIATLGQARTEAFLRLYTAPGVGRDASLDARVFRAIRAAGPTASTRSVATLTGSEKRLGPALPGFSHGTRPSSCTRGRWEWPATATRRPSAAESQCRSATSCSSSTRTPPSAKSASGLSRPCVSEMTPMSIAHRSAERFDGRPPWR